MTRGGLELMEKSAEAKRMPAASGDNIYSLNRRGPTQPLLQATRCQCRGRPNGCHRTRGKFIVAKLGQENGLQIWVTDFATNEDTAKNHMN